MQFPRLAGPLAFLCASAHSALAVIFLSTADPAHNNSTPGDNSGWQFEGQFNGFLGTPIAPNYFITANHIGGSVGDSFVFHGETFTTTASYSDPSGGDLHIWQVDHAFATYAPLYSSGGEAGQELRVIGRGTQRGAALTISNVLKGWSAGTPDNVQRWGRNLVTAISNNLYLQANFDNPGLTDEVHLSSGDSGGGVFILENGLWKLAGINYAVDDLYTSANANSGFSGAVFDARGYYVMNTNGTFYKVSGSKNVPTAFYSSRIYGRLAWIQSVTGVDGTALPAETFANWQHAYFTPAQLTDNNISSSSADPDGDGLPNLSEFAFNLDPTFNESVIMTASTGLRGLPLIRQETIAASNDQRLTVEFVRRTAASGSGITYTVQFTSSLAPATVNWRPGGTEVVTAINSRWERVKVTDSVAVGSQNLTRFARVLIPPVSS